MIVSVRNSGPGIPPDDAKLIFDRFYKTDKSRSKDKTGMGLGLYIVKTMIQLHGGEIRVESVENDYTLFEFWIPNKRKEIRQDHYPEQGKARLCRGGGYLRKGRGRHAGDRGGTGADRRCDGIRRGNNAGKRQEKRG